MNVSISKGMLIDLERLISPTVTLADDRAILLSFFSRKRGMPTGQTGYDLTDGAYYSRMDTLDDPNRIIDLPYSL
jgi:hypothetical protein